MIRLMIVDDQKILLDGLAHLFEHSASIQVVKQLSFSEIAEVAAQVVQPDIILMDICMEGRTSGIETTRRIKEKMPRQKIVIMTGFPDVHFVEMAKEAGADSFIYKESSAKEFVDCLERTMAGEHIFPNVQEKTTFGFYHAQLTARELEMLRLICQNKSYQEIADELHITKRTVSFHISNMLAKTGHKSIVGLAVEAADKGYYSSGSDCQTKKE